MEQQFDLFISHSSHDKAKVRELYGALVSLGLRVWLDERELHVGDSLYQELSKALREVDFVVFCVSRAAIASGWVDREIGGAVAQQIQSRKKRILPIRLDDAPIPDLLGDLVWLDLRSNRPGEVARQIYSAIQAARSSLSAAAVHSHDVTKEVANLLSQLGGAHAAPGFCWAIVSGPSSAGKDVLSYVVLQTLQQSHGLSILEKVTTRPRRPSEPDYVQQLTEDEFLERCRNKAVMFPFRKRGFRYGFNASQFRMAVSEGTPLLSVFTEFRLVPAVSLALNTAGIRTTPFLLTAPKEDLLRRVLFRNLPTEEIAARVASIEQDYREMASRSNLDAEYVFIENGDSRAFSSAAAELTAAIRDLVG